ncbi:MAG: murein biosynthesis integral membrane protein MurJ [Aestuariivita sp.]|nr:murein biosynthesis integral membrane protein MurJ [Aestuariivita sp.]
MNKHLKPIRLVTGFLTVGAWTLISRVFGFIRDVLIAAFLGAGPVAEAFLIAFSLPNMFRRLFAEGAFNTAFVPIFAKKLQADDAPRVFAQDAFSALGSVLIVLTLIAQLAMPWMVLAMASGFTGDIRFDLAVDYGRVIFIYVVFISLAALLAGILNANGLFAAAAAAPTLLNIILIGCMGAAFASFSEETAVTNPRISSFELHVGFFLIWGVVAAGLAQFGLVWWATSKIGFSLRPKLPRLTPELRRLAIIAAPAMLSGGVVQVNLLVGRQVGSFFDGAIAWLSFADRLYQLPLGVVGVAIGIVLLPELSRKLQTNDEIGSREALSRATELALALTIPATAALLVISEPLVSVLFERGAFQSDDVSATALAVAVYGVGLPAFVLQKVFQPLYFAREDTKTPFYYALVSMFINAAVAVTAAYFLGFIGAAIGTTVAGWSMLWLLTRGTKKMGKAARFDSQVLKRIQKMILATCLMSGVLFFLAWSLDPIFAMSGWRWLALVTLILSGITVYSFFGHVLGAFRIADIQKALRRSSTTRHEV